MLERQQEDEEREYGSKKKKRRREPSVEVESPRESSVAKTDFSKMGDEFF